MAKCKIFYLFNWHNWNEKHSSDCGYQRICKKCDKKQIYNNESNKWININYERF